MHKYFIGFYLGIMTAVCLKFFVKRGKPINYLQITHLYEADSAVKNINSGGCGYFALKLSERLDSFRYKIVVLNDRTHVVVHDILTGMYIDSRDAHSKLSLDLKYDFPVYKTISREALRKMVYTQKWNSDFNQKDTLLINYYINKL